MINSPNSEDLSLDLDTLPPGTRLKLFELAERSGMQIKDYVAAVVANHIADDWQPDSTKAKKSNSPAK